MAVSLFIKKENLFKNGLDRIWTQKYSTVNARYLEKFDIRTYLCPDIEWCSNQIPVIEWH
jgi:hypothetical protein